MRIKLTEKCKRGIGLRSISTKKLVRYEAGDELEVFDGVAEGLINSGMAEKVEDSKKEDGESDVGFEHKDEDSEHSDAESDEGSGSEDSEGNADSEEVYESMTKKEIVALLKERGKSTEGNKEELIARLVEE